MRKKVNKHYSVDEEGNVYSEKTGNPMKQNLRKDNYLQITFFLFDKKTKLIHRLIAEAFIPNPENKPCVNHKDGNKQNNNINNLEWSTHSENTKHAFKNNLIKNKRNQNGEKNNMVKLNEKQVKEIRLMYENGEYTQKQLGEIFNVKRQTIGDIINKRRWKHII